MTGGWYHSHWLRNVSDLQRMLSQHRRVEMVPNRNKPITPDTSTDPPGTCNERHLQMMLFGTCEDQAYQIQDVAQRCYGSLCERDEGQCQQQPSPEFQLLQHDDSMVVLASWMVPGCMQVVGSSRRSTMSIKVTCAFSQWHRFLRGQGQRDHRGLGLQIEEKRKEKDLVWDFRRASRA